MSSSYHQLISRYQSLYMKYPHHVHIETLGACNATCSFCPNSDMDRRNQRMSQALFEKVVNDLKQIPQDHEFMVSLFKVNEPLLDPKIFSRMEYVISEVPQAVLDLTTNLSIATSDMIDQMSQTSRLSSIWVSLNSLQPDEYKQWMGLPLERTVRNIKQLLRVNRASSSYTPSVILGRVGDNTRGDAHFYRDACSVFREFDVDKDFTVIVQPRGQWMGYTKTSAPPIPQNPCTRWFEVSITCTGEVAFCCMDGFCAHSLGNVKDKTVLEIYNQPQCFERRKKIPSRSEIDTCRNCTLR